MKIAIPETGQEITVYPTEELGRDLAEYRDLRCSHLHMEWRRLPTSNGGYQVKQQCMSCGKRRGNPRAQQPGDERLVLVDKAIEVLYDENRKRGYDEIYLKHARLQLAKKSTWWEGYNQYLSTEAWAIKRKLVFERSAGVCEGCRVRSASEVHHLNYQHVGNEFLFELVAVCDECHQRLHAEESNPLEELQDLDGTPEGDWS